MSNKVTVAVNGLSFGGFTTIRISAGIERQARDFQLDTTWHWPGQTTEIPVKQGDKVEVRIGSDLVVTGYVSATPVSYDARSISRSIVGRSLTADLVDCSSEVMQWREQSVLDIVKSLASQVNVSVVSEVDASLLINDHSVDPSETIFESIDRLLTISRLLSTDDERGNLVIAKPGSSGRSAEDLVLGQNIVSCRMAQDFSKCFSQYRVIGQRSGSDDLDATSISEVVGEQADPRIERNRLLIIQQSGQLTPELAKDRAVWESASRVAKALAVDYTIVGWRQSTGALWKANQLVKVKDEVAGLNRDMLITEVTYELSDSGMLTHLRLMPPEGLGTMPEAPKKGGKGQDSFEYLLPADWEK